MFFTTEDTESHRESIFSLDMLLEKKLCETLCPSVVNSRFSQVIHDQPDFPFKEAVAVFVVIDIGQCLCFYASSGRVSAGRARGRVPGSKAVQVRLWCTSG